MSKTPHRNPAIADMGRLGIFTNWRMPKLEEIELLLSGDSLFRDLIIGLPPKDMHAKRWYPKVNVDRWLRKIEEFKAAFPGRLEIYMMYWGVRNKQWLEDSLSHIKDISDELGTKPVLDNEGEWHKGNLDPYVAKDKIVDVFGSGYIVTGLDKLRSSLRPVVQSCSLAIPQAYSIWKPKVQNHWSHSSHTFPGYQQVRALNSWSQYIDKEKIVQGLSNYWGDRPATGKQPALTQNQTMMLAATQTIDLELFEAWYWTIEFLSHKSAKGRQVRKFFGLVEPK
jgi:hypothetical protein